MKYLLTGMIALTLLTACGQKDNPAGGGSRASVVFAESDLPDVKVRKGDAATASEALSAFSLTESGAGRLAFAGKDVKGDTAVFTNVTLTMPEDAMPDDSSGGLSEEELRGIFAFMDADGDGIADDGSDMTIEDLRAEMDAVYGGSSGPSIPPVIKAAKLEFDGLGMFDGQANFGRMTLTDITITPGEGSEENNTGKIKSVELINPSPETAAWVASLFGQGGAADFPEGKALSFDRWAVNGVSFDLDDASGAGKFTLDSFHISDLKEEKAGLFGLSKLNFDFAEAGGSDTKFSIEGFGVRGINYGLFSEAFQAGAGGDPSALTSAIQTDPANPGYDLLSLKALKADIVGVSLDMPQLDSAVTRDNQGRATKVVTKPFTLAVAPRDNTDGEEFAGVLASVGYDKLSFSGQGESLYDPDTDVATLPKGKNFWQLENGFKLDFSAKYEGSKAIAAMSSQSDTLAADPEGMLDTVMQAVAIHQLEIAYADAGFFNKALNAYATQAGEDPEAVRKSLLLPLAMAPMFAPQVGIDAAVATEFATALSGFIQDPKKLTISLAPKTPLKAQAFMEAGSDPAKKLTKESLGFTASNK
ncbi:MAG TPA: hypothetical protein PKY73_01965 [Hyphomonas sp.]|nr:hypothetical protein [Hyphomonas sp.]